MLKKENKPKTYVCWVNSIIHDISPTLENGNLEESEVCLTNVVKVNIAVDPGEVVLSAGDHVWYNISVHSHTKFIYTLVKK